MKKKIKINNKKIFIRNLVLKDCNLYYVKWLNDPYINKWLEVRWKKQNIKSVRQFVKEMNKSNINNDLLNLNPEILNWNLIQLDLKKKLGSDIYESWLKKISFVEEFNNYILLSVPTRFIRDWITSRYLDQILKVIKNYKKSVIRIEFKIVERSTNKSEEDFKKLALKENVSFIFKLFSLNKSKKFDGFPIPAKAVISLFLNFSILLILYFE